MESIHITTETTYTLSATYDDIKLLRDIVEAYLNSVSGSIESHPSETKMMKKLNDLMRLSENW